MRNASHFQRGSGCYTCNACGKRTRSTGRGDNENVGLCADCYDESGNENFHADNHGPMAAYETCPLCHPHLAVA